LETLFLAAECLSGGDQIGGDPRRSHHECLLVQDVAANRPLLCFESRMSNELKSAVDPVEASSTVDFLDLNAGEHDWEAKSKMPSKCCKLRQ
jgi:hypothetical protein